MKLYGKKHALSVLERYRKSGRFPHALLITGENGIGKGVLADYSAMLYLCKNGGSEPCMTCNECRRTEEHIHPDVIYPLDVCGGKYKLETLRNIIAEGYKIPNDGDVRVYIFEKLDEMSEACQNSLLKFIEEPLSFNRYIFTAAKKSAVITTVLSRVTALECDGVSRDEFIAAMNENGIPHDKSEKYFGLFGGNIGISIQAEKNPSSVDIYDKTAEISDMIAEKKESECLKLFESLKTRDDMFEAVGMLSDIFANSAIYKSGVKKTCAFYEQISKISSRFTLSAINNLCDEACRLYSLKSTMVNAKLFACECCASLFKAIETDMDINQL